jgi:hypothetical protein
MEVWFYVINGVPSNPVSWDELKSVAASGKLSPDDLVWKEGTPDWVPARTVAGLFASTSATPATYGLSPPPPPPPHPLADATLPLDDGSTDPTKPRRTRSRDRDPNAPPPNMQEWVKLIQLFLLRTFNPDPSQVQLIPDEEAALTESGVMDATARKFAAWRRSVLFVAAVPCAFAALFGLIHVLAMDEKMSKIYSSFGIFLLLIQSLSLFALPVAAVMGALNYHKLSVSATWVLIGGLVSSLVPLAIAFVPGSWFIDVPDRSKMTQEQLDMALEIVGRLLGIIFFLQLIPMVLSLLPAVSRACIRLKMLLPESLVPGWGLVVIAPLCVLLVLATFVLLYHMVGNVLFLLGLLLWIGAPLFYLTKLNFLTRPLTAPAERMALGKMSLVVLGLTAFGVLLLLIFMLTASLGGETILGFDKSKSYIRPWTLALHKTWLEYLGRSLFLTVFFGDLLLRVVLSVWRESRAFAGSPEAANFDHAMSGLSSALLPRGSSPTT